ncbi:flagellar associated protein [Cardiosporidium cionae]|uniref:Flagellar associated protein n=1 Tax=Cardiosporidium cionae TaxID=476202 RepID=A0ABQ7J6S8_9APIC|nr:flagellar associated protein [Cardiosporidium cionae]|eukprot:KAF8819691.1 flagellar associated protein [Cardiosporidium cionae]
MCANIDKQAMESLFSQSRALNKNILDFGSTAEMHRGILKQRDIEAIHLQKEITEHKKEIAVTVQRIEELQRHKEKLSSELSKAKLKYTGALEELRSHEMGAKDLQGDIAQLKSRITQQKGLYAVVRAERNTYSNEIMRKKSEITDLKSKFKVMFQQIEKLKKGIKEKDESIVQQHYEARKLKLENEHIQRKLLKASKSLPQLQGVVDTQKSVHCIVHLKAEMAKLEITIQQAEARKENQSEENRMIIAEKESLNAQLAKRNVETSLLLEKIKVQKCTLSKAMMENTVQSTKIKNCNKHIASLRRELNNAKNNAQKTQDIEKEIAALQKDYLLEKLKVAALSEELQKPTRMHKWRKLEAVEPALFEMLQKCQFLQKSLLAKSEQVATKNIEIEEKEKLYQQLQALLERHPGPQILHELTLSRKVRALHEKSLQIRALTSELKEYRTKITSYKNEIEQLSLELHDLRKGIQENLSNEIPLTH